MATTTLADRVGTGARPFVVAGQPVFCHVVTAARFSTTTYMLGRLWGPTLAQIENYHLVDGTYVRGWVVKDAEGRVISEPFGTKSEAEDFLRLELLTRPQVP